MTEEEFYSPGDIVFSKPQCLWLIRHLDLLRIGSWPPDYKETGYTGTKGKHKRQAYFETPVGIAAEIDFRLERTGVDGILLEFVYTVDPQDQLSLQNHIASAMRVELRDIERRLSNALAYIAGWKRKERSYKQYRQHKRSNPR